MDIIEKLNEFAELRGWDKNKLIGWSEAADFGEWLVKNTEPIQDNAVRAAKSKFKFGDIVIVKDGSNNIDKTTGIKRSGADPLFKNYKAVVVETGLNLGTFKEFEYYNRIAKLKSWMFSDLLLKFETGEEVYTSSEMCKLYTGDELDLEGGEDKYQEASNIDL